MTLHEARQLARQKMDLHGLSDWKFEFSNSQRVLGSCWFRHKKIDLSRTLVLHNADHEVLDTILHEIAHALAGIHNGHFGHGRPWKMWCVRIGAKPQRCAVSAEITTIPKWILVDSTTGNVVKKFYKKPTKDYSQSWVRGKPETKGLLKLVANHSGKKI